MEIAGNPRCPPAAILFLLFRYAPELEVRLEDFEQYAVQRLRVSSDEGLGCGCHQLFRGGGSRVVRAIIKCAICIIRLGYVMRLDFRASGCASSSASDIRGTGLKPS